MVTKINNIYNKQHGESTKLILFLHNATVAGNTRMLDIYIYTILQHLIVKRVSTGKLIPFLKAALFFVVIDQSLPNTVILEHLLISCDMSEGKHFPVYIVCWL